MKPVYKIETYTGANLDHTIERDALTIYTKELITSGVGTFSFTVPTKKNGSGYLYNDIARNDKIKIWFGYDNISGDPTFVGKVTNINGSLSTAQGYTRQICGLSQGEILLRRLKRDKLWTATDASSVVTEIANDLGLGTSQIETDTTDVNIEVKAETYFDLLKRISDYWYDATNKIQKDFYVNVNNNLVWKSRPLRTDGVETFTVGENILFYKVTYPILPVKNDIRVFGRTYDTPSNHDAWTESTTNWDALGGTLSTSTNRTIGQCSVQGDDTGTGPTSVDLRRTISSVRCGWKFHRYLNFDWWVDDDGSLLLGNRLSLYCLAPDWNNRFWDSPFINLPYKGEWHTEKVELGPHNSNWNSTGSPDWNDVQGFEFHYTTADDATSATIRIDKLYLSDSHYYGTASDANSQTNYGQRDLDVTDTRLLSDSDCTKRAETLLMQKKDPPTQIEIMVPGNTNILVGDRLSMTIPAENINSENFDVIMVEHMFSARGFLTKATMVNNANIRTPSQTTELDILISNNQKLRELARDEKVIA